MVVAQIGVERPLILTQAVRFHYKNMIYAVPDVVVGTEC